MTLFALRTGSGRQRAVHRVSACFRVRVSEEAHARSAHAPEKPPRSTSRRRKKTAGLPGPKSPGNGGLGPVRGDPDKAGIFVNAVLRCRGLVDASGGLKGVSAESKLRSAACRYQVFRPSACRAGAAAPFPLATEKHVPARPDPAAVAIMRLRRRGRDAGSVMLLALQSCASLALP